MAKNKKPNTKQPNTTLSGELFLHFQFHQVISQKMMNKKGENIEVNSFFNHHRNDGVYRDVNETIESFNHSLSTPTFVYPAKRSKKDKICLRAVYFSENKIEESVIALKYNNEVQVFHNLNRKHRKSINKILAEIMNTYFEKLYFIDKDRISSLRNNRLYKIFIKNMEMVDGGFVQFPHSNLSPKVAILQARLANDNVSSSTLAHPHYSDTLSSTNERNYNKNKKQNQGLNMNNKKKNISQVDNTHYTNMKIEPMEYFTANNMGFAEANAIKYITRYKSSQGDKRMQDIKKAEHYIQILQEAIQNGLTPKNKRKNSAMVISPSAFCEANNIEGRDREFIVAVSLGNLEVAKSIILNTMRKEGIRDEQEQTASLNRQVGGNHYSRMPIQPMSFISTNQMGFGDGNIIKYVTRYKFKNGLKDLEKAQEQFKLLEKYGAKKTYDTKISIDEYCQKNKITGLDAEVLKASYNCDYTKASRLIADLIAQYKNELKNETKIGNEKEKTMENTTKKEEILLDKIEQAEISKLEEIYKNNVLVKHFCEALDLYPVNYDSTLDDKDIVKELYHILKNPEQIQVNNYKPFSRGAFDIADYMDDDIDEDSGEFLDREGFMEKMTEYLQDEIGLNKIDAQNNNEIKNTNLSTINKNMLGNTLTAKETEEHIQEKAFNALNVLNNKLWDSLDNITDYAEKVFETNGDLNDDSEPLQILEDLENAREEIFSLLSYRDDDKKSQFYDIKVQLDNICGVLDYFQNYDLKGRYDQLNELYSNLKALSNMANFAETMVLNNGFEHIRNITNSVLESISNKSNSLFGDELKDYEFTLDNNDKRELYNNNCLDINAITKSFLPAKVSTNLIDLASLRTDLAIKIATGLRLEDKDLTQIPEIEKAREISDFIFKYIKAENIINDKESLFEEFKESITQNDELFLKTLQHSLAENIIKINDAEAMYNKNFNIVNYLTNRSEVEMNKNNTNLIDLALRNLEIATLKLVQEHYPKSEIAQAINEKLAIDKIQSELNYRNDNSLFDESFSQKDYYQNLLNDPRTISESYKEQLYKDFKEEIDTITQSFVKDSSLDLSELKTDLALKIISASALKKNLNTIPELAELEKINTALEQYGLLEQAKYSKENLFEEKFISSYKLEGTKLSIDTDIQINSFIDKALNKIQSATKDLYNNTLNTIYTDKINAKLDEALKQSNPSNQGKIGLRDYQQASVDALLKSDKGLVQAPTGSGKTHIIAGLIEQSGLKTLIVTPSVALVGQAYNTIKQTMPNANVGVLGGATKNKEKQIEKDIIISTWQSLSKMDINNFPHKMLIVDECHHATADVLQSIIQKLNQNGLKTYGLSATAYRTTEEQNEVLKKTFGNNIAYKVDVEDLYERGFLVRPSISIVTPHQRNFNFVGLNSGEGSFNHIIEEAKNPKNDFIGKICNYCYSYHKNCPNSEFLPKKITPNGNEKPVDKSEIYKARDILQDYLARNPSQDDFTDALYNAMKGKNYELKNSTEQERKSFSLIGEYMRLYTDSQRANSTKYEKELKNQPNGYAKIIGSIKSGIDNSRTHRQDVYSVLEKNISTSNNQTLVLSNTVEFAKSIANEVKSKHPNVEVIYFDGKQKNKNEILDNARKNNNYILVATTQSMSEGVDIPNINKVVVASPALPPFSSMATLEQVVGRSIRPYENKDTAEIIMFDLNVTEYKNKFEETLNIVADNLHPKEIKRFASISDYQSNTPKEEIKNDSLFNNNWQSNINNAETLETNNNLLP